MVTLQHFTYKLICKNSPEENTRTKDFVTELVTSTQKRRLKNKKNETSFNSIAEKIGWKIEFALTNSFWSKLRTIKRWEKDKSVQIKVNCDRVFTEWYWNSSRQMVKANYLVTTLEWVVDVPALSPVFSELSGPYQSVNVFSLNLKNPRSSILIISSLFSVMHLGAVAAMLFRHHDNKTLQDLLKRLDKDSLIGTLVFSDPATGRCTSA